jgi:hypothetical protein
MGKRPHGLTAILAAMLLCTPNLREVWGLPPKETKRGTRGRVNMGRIRYGLNAAMLVMILSVSTLSWAQKSDPQGGEVFWLNLPSSPLRIAATPNGRHLEARNHSTGTVAGYELGCVTQESGKTTIKSRFKSEEVNLGPVDQATGKVWFVEIDFKDRDLCEHNDAKLAVVSVRFADGSHWTIN